MDVKEKAGNNVCFINSESNSSNNSVSVFYSLYKLIVPLLIIVAAGWVMSCSGPQKTGELLDLPDLTDSTEVPVYFDHPVLDQVTEKVKDFNVGYDCSLTEPRVIIANIAWRTEPEFVSRQRLDVSVYKDGFDERYFVSLSMGQPDAGLLHARPDQKISSQPYAATLSLSTDSLGLQTEGGEVRFQLKHLNPQTNYRWRVLNYTEEGWIPTNTIVESTPTCISDMVEG